MRLRIVLGFTLLVVLVGVSGCAGKTIVLEDPGASATNDVESPEGEETSGTAESPTDTPDPSETSSEPEPSDPDDDQTGWWPPAPSPTATPGGEGAEEPSEPESSEGSSSPETEEPSDENTGEEETPGSERYTFPNWQEYIYSSRNGGGPEKFANRDRFPSCGDFASRAGADLISPDVAKCLDDGKNNNGKESAIAVRTADESVHVWFIRVGPKGSEYFIDRTQAGDDWLHANCESGTSIGVLACEEPTPLKEANEDNDEDEGIDESEPPTESPDETPSETPDKSPSSPSTPSQSSTQSEEPVES